MMTEQSGAGALETTADAGEGDAGLVKRWLMEWELSSKTEEQWRNLADEAVERFRDEGQAKTGDKRGRDLGTRFNILRANVETLQPALYNSPPKPDVRRRYRDTDPLGKAVAETLERAIAFQLDTGDFDGLMNLAVRDMLLPGRGFDRVRYKPVIQGEAGSEYKAWESVCVEHVQWRDFRRGPGRTWADVTWIGFELYPTREEAVALFGDKAKAIELDAVPEGRGVDAGKAKGGPDEDTFKRLRVYEIWDKATAKVLFIAPQMKEMPLKVEDDPLGLEGFFPGPRPLYACEQTDTLVPVEDYRAYRDQAEELDRITARISRLIAACKVRGVYNSVISEFAEVLKSGDNELVPAENATTLAQMGGLEKAVWLMPVETIAKVLVELYNQREQIKTTIYELTGIADIMRGSTEASETLGAQKLKSAYGGQRISARQREVQRYARDLVRLVGEIIAEHFDAQTLAMMTGLQYPPEQWQQIMGVLRSDALRSFRVDIETDSTIAGDLAAAQENAAKFVEGLSSTMQALAPAVEAGAMPMEIATKILVGLSQMFKLPRSVTDAFESLADAPAQPPGPKSDPNAPAMAKAQGEVQARMAEVQQAPQIEQMKAQIAAQGDVAEARISADAEKTKALIAAQTDMRKAYLSSLTAIEVARIGAGVDAGTQMYAAELQTALGIHANLTDADVERERIANQPEPEPAAA